MQRSAIIGEAALWTSPVPYVLDKGLGKYKSSYIKFVPIKGGTPINFVI